MSLAANASSVIATIPLYSPSGQTLSSLAYNTNLLVVAVRTGSSSSFTDYGIAGVNMVTCTAGTYTSAGFTRVRTNAAGVTIEFHIPAAFIVAGQATEIIVEYNSEIVGKWREVINLPVADSSGRTQVQSGTSAGQILSSSGQVTVGTLSAAAIQSIWDALTSALTTVGSIGKYIIDRLDAAISSRMATFTYTAPDNTTITAINAKTTNLPAAPASEGNVTAVGNAVVAVGNALTTLAAKFTGITLMAGWLRKLMRKDSVDATTDSEIGGTYSGATDSLEAQQEAGGGSNITAAQVWQYANRSLTNYPASLSLAVPQPGTGLFIPGARFEQNPSAYRGSAIAGTTIVLLARMVGADGDYLLRADVTSASSVVLNLSDSTDTTTVSHTVSAIVYDELQADGRWTEDGVGYNVAATIAGSRIPNAGTTYRITLTLNTADGAIKTQWDMQT